MKKSPDTKPKGATSYKETAFGILPRLRLLKLELEGTKKGLDLIHKLVSEKGEIEITPSLILKIHGESFGWIFPSWAGKYRTERVEFSGKEAVSPHKVPELIASLCLDLKERLKHFKSQDIAELLAWFQHRFVLIHPFLDYNGRIARMLTILILLKLGLPPIEIKAETGNDREKYLQAMYDADRGNYQKLINLIDSALKESLTR